MPDVLPRARGERNPTRTPPKPDAATSADPADDPGTNRTHPLPAADNAPPIENGNRHIEKSPYTAGQQ